MSEQEQELNVFDVTQAVDLMKHTIGLTGKYEKKLQFIPWRNYFDGQNDCLDKMAELGYVIKRSGWTPDDPVYCVSLKGFQWLQDFVNVEILLPVAKTRGLL